jgi:hypothetical protein
MFQKDYDEPIKLAPYKKKLWTQASFFWRIKGFLQNIHKSHYILREKKLEVTICRQ